MDAIGFTAEEKALLAGTLQRYFSEALKQSIGRFDAEFMIDFISGELGEHHYSRGVADAQAVLAKRAEDLADAVWPLQRPTGLGR